MKLSEDCLEDYGRMELNTRVIQITSVGREHTKLLANVVLGQ